MKPTSNFTFSQIIFIVYKHKLVRNINYKVPQLLIETIFNVAYIKLKII
jgi:hypothetical protein